MDYDIIDNLNDLLLTKILRHLFLEGSIWLVNLLIGHVFKICTHVLEWQWNWLLKNKRVRDG